ncbi:MAG: polysaccharide pyruvyl transferase CsaB [Armatimonadota bacterium]|nr:polysaccharide pyruvyl transferase CsaB [Armatimonadota bacterium]MDR7533299.1 polysaccharide pyruvyl transferase CsaB [Armatimonadota bacterium]MDR7536582.1 polysaccharide pyruvyl transferase CsaB [Armatimonadota bacterium]
MARRRAGPPRRGGGALDPAPNAPILIAGYYGLGNLGDEAVLAGLLAALRRLVPEGRVVVLSADPAATLSAHRVEAVARSPQGVWHALAGAGLLIMGGGSLVQDVTSARSAVYYLGVMLAAGVRGVPVAAVGQGIGPLRRRWIRGLARVAFTRAAVVDVRDRDSAATLAALGVRRPVRVGADLAFLLDPAPAPVVQATLARYRLDRARARIGVAFRAWAGLPPVATTGAVLRRFARAVDADIAVLVFDRARDRALGYELAAAADGRVVEVDTPAELLAFVGTMDLVVGVRLHALIFAVAQGVPAVGLAYDPKITAFAAEQGLPVVPVDASPEALARTLDAIWAVRGDLRARLRPAAARLRELAADAVAAAVAARRPRYPLAGVPATRPE